MRSRQQGFIELLLVLALISAGAFTLYVWIAESKQICKAA